MEVPPFKVEFSEEEIAQAVGIYKDVLTTGRLILGKYTLEAEAKLGELEGIASVILVNSGTSALEVIFRCLNSKKVLCPTQTNFATAEAIVRAGAEPLFYDGGLFPSFESIKKTHEKFPGIDTLVVVHLGGVITEEMDLIEEWSKNNGISLVTDAAHAHGCSLKDKKVAQFGVATALSFFPTKVITSFEGGAILTNDEKIAKLARVYRDQGKDSDGITNILHGNSWRMPEDHAGLLSIQLDSFLKDNQKRKEVIIRYNKKFSNLSWLTLPLFGREEEINGYKMVIQVQSKDTRDALKNYLSGRGVMIGKGIYDIPLHRQPVFSKHVSQQQSEFPLADYFSKTHMCLPCWKKISSEELEYVLDTLIGFEA